MSKADEYLEQNEFLKNEHGVYHYQYGPYGVNLKLMLEDFQEECTDPLIDHLKWILRQFECDGMENMGVREQVIYEQTEKIIKEYES